MKEKTPETKKRPPIVVVLGHVDHGKSTLLDYIRKTNTTKKEAGGITQHISAYEVVHKTKDGEDRRITFLDTPGHQAFSKMRERGANLADIAILVISGEDGVKEQTLEVLKTIRESAMPYIVAVSKIDKPHVDVERVKNELATHEVFVEGYGGDVPIVPVSAKTGAGIPELLDMILLLADLENLTGNPSLPAEGVVVESHVDPRQGVSGTIIITNGTLKKGMSVVASNTFAPVRNINAFLDHTATEATFSSPVIITGFDTVPPVGSLVQSFLNKKDAVAFIEKNKSASAHTKQPTKALESEDSFFIPLIIKADAVGSLEAIEHEIEKLNKNQNWLRIIHSGVGSIEEGDLKTALGGKSPIIVGFHVGIGKTMEKIVIPEHVTVKTFNIIYKLTEWLTEEMKKRAPKTLVEERTGSAKILKIFNKTKNKQVVGGCVTEGELRVRGKIKIMRRGKEIDRGEIIELQQQKTKVGRVEEGLEFGALVESKYDLATGDVIEVFILVEK